VSVFADYVDRFAQWRERLSAAIAVVSLGVLIVLTSPADADSRTQSATNAGAFGEIPAPKQTDAIPLREAVADSTQEQWELSSPDMRSVRNVVTPTLTPVLPDPARATGAAVIVAPGGAFYMLSIDSEGYAVAHWLAEHGVAAFVLKYRTQVTPRDPKGYREVMSARMSKNPDGKPIETPVEAIEDAKAAVRLVRARAADWAIDPRRVGFAGFSAGAMTALSVGLVDDAASRPDFIAPIYPPMLARDVPDFAPPMFLAIALDDPLFAVNKDLGLIQSWRKARRPIEVHLYERGGHGFGMNDTSQASGMWIEQFYAWMNDRGIVGNEFMRANDGARYSVAKSTIGELLDNPQSRAILDKYIPQITRSDRIELMRGQTLAQIQGYARDVLTPDKLNAVQAELGKISRKQ